MDTHRGGDVVGLDAIDQLPQLLRSLAERRASNMGGTQCYFL